LGRGFNKGLWDLQVVYQEDDSSAEWVGYDLTTINKIIIRYNKKKDVMTAERVAPFETPFNRKFDRLSVLELSDVSGIFLSALVSDASKSW